MKKEHNILHCIVEMKVEHLLDNIGVAIVNKLLYFMTLLQIPPFYFFSSLTQNSKVQVLCSPSVQIPSWSFVQLTSKKISIIWDTEKVTFYALLTATMEFNRVISCVSYSTIYVWLFYYSFNRMVWEIKNVLLGQRTQGIIWLVL